MKLDRRGFLGGLFAAPVAGKKIVQDMANKLAVKDPLTGLSSMAPDEWSDYIPFSESMSDPKNISLFKQAVKSIAKHGVPKDTKKVLWRSAWADKYIEPDVASLRSVSLSAKRSMAAHRKYKRSLDNYADRFVSGINDERFDNEVRKFIRFHGPGASD